MQDKIIVSSNAITEVAEALNEFNLHLTKLKSASANLDIILEQNNINLTDNYLLDLINWLSDKQNSKTSSFVCECGATEKPFVKIDDYYSSILDKPMMEKLKEKIGIEDDKADDAYDDELIENYLDNIHRIDGAMFEIPNKVYKYITKKDFVGLKIVKKLIMKLLKN